MIVSLLNKKYTKGEGDKMKKATLLILTAYCLFGTLPTYASGVTVSNVRSKQVEGTRTVEILYDLTPVPATVTLIVKNGNEIVSSPSLSGDVGDNVLAGTNRRIVWNAQADWPNNASAKMTFQITATNYLPLVYECPAGGDATAGGWEIVNSRCIRNYYANGDITMSDKTTGLMWVYDAAPYGNAGYDEANSRCAALVYAGYTDWYLPDKDQLSAIYSQISFFIGLQEEYYWSSTRVSPTVWEFYVIRMSTGYILGMPTNRANGVWPCR